MQSNKRIVDATSEPVTPEQLDTQLRGDGVLAAEEGDFLQDLIKSAREYVEEHTRRALITQTWRLVMDAFPSVPNNDLKWWDGVREGSISMGTQGYIELPRGPLQSITSFKVYNNDNSSTTVDSTSYFADINSTPGQLILNTGVAWPVFTRHRNGIEIDYVAGYGDLVTDVPSPLRTAIKQLAAHWYENRELVKTQSDQNQAMAPIHVQSILNRYRVKKL